MIKKSFLALVAMMMCLPFAVKAQAPEAFLTLEDLESQTYPYALSSENATSVFGKESLTIAMDITTGSSTGNEAFICASDISVTSNDDKYNNNSTFVAVGSNGGYVRLFATAKDKGWYSSKNKLIKTNTNHKVVIVMNKSNSTRITYVDGVKASGNANSYAALGIYQDFNHFSGNANAGIFVGGGKNSAGDLYKFAGQVHSVSFYDGALTDAQVNEIVYPREAKLNAAREAAKTSIAEAVATLKNQPGYYSCTINGVKVYDEATVHTAIDAAQSEDAINAIVTAVNAKTLILPEVGKAYRISYDFGNDNVKYMQCVSAGVSNKANAPLLSNEKGENSIFLVTQEGSNLRLQAYATGQYLKHDSSDRGFHATGGNVTFEQGSSLGKVKIKGDYYLHAVDGNPAYVDRCSGDGHANHNFIMEEIPSYTLTIESNVKSEVSATWNGQTKTLPATWSVLEGTTITDPILTVTDNETYNLANVTEGGAELASMEISSLTANRTLTANFAPTFFADTYADAVPVRIYNDDDNTYFIKLNTPADCNGKGLNSVNAINFVEAEQWYFVGTAASFTMYNRAVGSEYAVKVSGTAAGSVATMAPVAEATPLKLTLKGDGSYRIAPVAGDADMSFNMYGGKGNDIKLHNSSGSEWLIERMPKNPLTILVSVEGEQPYATNTRVAELSYENSNGVQIITKDTKQIQMYVPFGDIDLVEKFRYRGYKLIGYYYENWDGPTDFGMDQMADEGLTVRAKYSVDTNNKAQYLFWYRSEDINAPYRIPAITVNKAGKVIAITDYRPCGDDIGMGEVDIMFRSSTESFANWDGKSWTPADYIADGQGGNENVYNVGFGDAAVVSDRESNKTLVMAVAGKQRFNKATSTSHNSVARIYSEDGTNWVDTDVTADFLGEGTSLFPDAYSGFITSGRILQSATYKKAGAEYYRIYAVAVINDDGNSSYPNYVLYSDDFGTTWKILGGAENGVCCDAGNETKIEELPNGDLVVSVRKSGGRYFNVFSYGEGVDDKANGVGTWDITPGETKVTSSFGASDCNGELLRVGNVLLQSIPKRGFQGKDRSNVAIYYKVLDPEKDYTAAEIATGWSELTQVSYIGSAYSTMTLLPDGKTLGFLFEEDPDDGTFAYCIVYLPIDLTEVMSEEVQKAAFVVNSSIGAYEIGTFYANHAVEIPDGVKAYVATETPNDGTITMYELDGIIPAQTGALIKGTAGTYAFYPTTTNETVEGNLMRGYAGIFEHEDVVKPTDGSTNYVLTVKNEEAGFYRKSAGFKVYNNKAYLNVPQTTSGSIRLRFINNNGTTDIMEVPTEALNADGAIYDLSGRRVGKAEKGVYIVNGKKVVF